MSALRQIVHGITAGAVGTTALNTVTYVDMATRARPASASPQKAVAELAAKAGHPVPGQGADHENRLQGIGPLAGILTGVGVGALAGALRPALRRLPAPAAAALIGLAAMALTDGPLVSLGLTDPRDWSKVDWLSDIVPHLVYGAATYATLQAAAE
jgi:hypothetical protein